MRSVFRCQLSAAMGHRVSGPQQANGAFAGGCARRAATQCQCQCSGGCTLLEGCILMLVSVLCLPSMVLLPWSAVSGVCTSDGTSVAFTSVLVLLQPHDLWKSSSVQAAHLCEMCQVSAAAHRSRNSHPHLSPSIRDRCWPGASGAPRRTRLQMMKSCRTLHVACRLASPGTLSG